MTDEQSDNKSYKDSLKATSLFGGVQVYNILIGIIRSKFIAVLLGPEGMGISGLLSATVGLVSSCTNFGIGTSAVRDISEANGTGDTRRIALVIGVFRKLVWMTGLLGAVLCLVLSPYLSLLTFGNKDYTLGFAVLSCTLLFAQITSGQTTLLQGMRKYAYMAKSNILGNTIGLFTTVPLYFLWGIDGIVPVLVISSVVSLALSYYFSRKVKIEKIPIRLQQVKTEGKGMVKMGFFISLNGLLAVGASYIVRIFISNYGGVADVGLYAAGFAIVNTYVGLVFTAMGTDYYPRLSEANKDRIKFNQLINTQIELSILLLAPVIAAFIIFIKLIVTLLYSSQFIPVEGMIYWTIFAIFFKAASWAIAYSFLAKGDTKAFFYNECLAMIYTLALNIGCYYVWGLTGMGISFLLSYVLYVAQVGLVCTKRYQFSIHRRFFKTFGLQLLLSCICILIVLYTPLSIRYTVGSCLVLLSFYYSYKKLDEQIGVSEFIKRKLNK